MNAKRRSGFTLIELMVAMALTLFIMVILTQAFVLALETFAGMKGIGDMQQNLRTATTLLREDMAADHFEGKRRLSDVSINGVPLVTSDPIQSGFFAVYHGSAVSPLPGSPYSFEGLDVNGMPSARATDHMLYMTCKRRGNRQENFYTASLVGNANNLVPFFIRQTAYDLPAWDVFTGKSDTAESTLTTAYNNGNLGYYSSQWAEVVYYLKRQGSTDEPNNPASTLGTPTYVLYRAQFVMVPDGTPLRATAPAGNIFVNQPNPVGLDNFQRTTFMQMSTDLFNAGLTTPQWQLRFLSPNDAAQGARMIPTFLPLLFNPQSATPTTTTTRVMLNEAPVLENVISFQVQVMPTGGAGFIDVPPNGGSGTLGRLYDTNLMMSTTPNYTNRAGLKALQVTLRVFDNKTRQSRQVTMIQDI